MKIGILTFHSQQNYGGVLQCWALKSVLAALGHEVVVIDRWLEPQQTGLRGILSCRHPKSWLSYVYRLVRGRTDLGPFVRAIRSIRFVKELGLTPYHFVDWKDAPRQLGVDLVVVGSDQIWNCKWGDPTAYLLEGAEERVPRAIAYAVSFGMKSLPAEQQARYREGLARFSALSCREKEGVEICRGLGFDATHVVDPTLLAEPSAWRSLLSDATSVRRTLVCYFLEADIASALPSLEAFAVEQDCRVLIMTRTPVWYRTRRVEICAGYGPKEFVQAFATATWVLADSFHAAMFSTVFGRNLRLLKPDRDFRREMFARIEEFVATAITGPVLVDTIEEALGSFAKGVTISYDLQAVETLRQRSLNWLKASIEG